MNGLIRAKYSHPNVNYRHVIAPSVALPSTWIPLSLNATDVQSIIDQGFTDGNQAIKNKMTNIEDYLEYYKMKKSTKPQKLTFSEFVEMNRSANLI